MDFLTSKNLVRCIVSLVFGCVWIGILVKCSEFFTYSSTIYVVSSLVLAFVSTFLYAKLIKEIWSSKEITNNNERD